LKNHKFYDYKLFWKAKAWFKSVNLGFNILKFRARKKYLFEKEKLSVRKINLLDILKNIILAFFAVGVLFLIEGFFQNIYLNHIDNFPNWFKSIADKTPKPKYPESQDSVEGFISLIASISGVLLALFYPVLATIASSGYAKVNSSIRNLLFLEPVTQNYLGRLAFLTAYSVCVLLLTTFGIYPGNLIILFLAFLSLISLFNLLKIGSGVYSLFEPNTLATIAIKQIVDNMRNVTVKSAYWDNQSFQAFFRRQVEKDIEILKLLNVIAIEGVSINEKSFLNTTSNTLNLLEHYLDIKNNIPLKSRWFKNKSRHRSHFETDMKFRQLSIDTNTYIPPEEIPNNFWFEERIFDIYSEIGQKVSLLENQEMRYKYIFKSARVLMYLGHSFEYNLADKLIYKNYSIAKASLIHNTKNTYENSKSNLVLIEAVISSSIRDYHLSFFQAIEFNTKERFNGKIKSIDWAKKSSLYKLRFPYKLNSFFEEYFNYLENEKFIEGEQITPVWYITQHLTAEYLVLVNNNFKKIIEQIKTFVIPLIEHCKENNNHLAVSFACHCALEVIDKIKFRIPQINDILQEFSVNNLHEGSHTWTKIDTENAYLNLNKLNDRFVMDIAVSMEKIYHVKWNDNNPDVFARSFAIVSNEINSSFANKDLKKLKKIFPSFLKSASASFYSLYEDRYKDKYYHHLEVIYQIHIELMQLSGLAYVYSELFGIAFWDEIVKHWDNLNMGKDQITLMIMSYNYYTNEKLGTGINFNENFNRGKQLLEAIKNENINVEQYQDTIIRRYVADRSLINKGYEELFLEMYLFTFPEIKEEVLEIGERGRRQVFFDINRIYGKK